MAESSDENKSRNLLPYADSVSGPSIQLPDIGKFKSEKGTAASNYFNTKLKELNEEYKKLVEVAKITELVYNSRYNFIPIVGKTYHLYNSSEGTFLSLVGPTEWSTEKDFLGSFIYTADAYWEKVND